MTYEEIKQKYPVGKVLYTKSLNACHRRVWFNEEDLKSYRSQYDSVTVYPDNTCDCYGTNIYQTKVEGWVFDGKEWHVAKEEEEDGKYVWEIFSKDELEELEVKRLRKEYLESHILEF